MEIRLRKFNDLTPEELSVWSRIQVANEHVDSPFFRPEFATIVHRACQNVEVALMLEKGFPIAFFPFQRVSARKGKPLGLTLSDFQGLIGPRSFKEDAAEIVKGCELASWDFRRVPRSQSWLQGYEGLPTKSYFVDISQGFEAYYDMLRHRGTIEMQEAEKSYGKLERDVGAVRLVLNYQQGDMFTAFRRWKEMQSEITGVTDPLARKWVQPVLEAIMQEKQLPFMGMSVGLYAGSQLVAVDFGIRSQHVLHCLGSAFDSNYTRYQPSQCLRLAYFRWAAEHGVRRIDLAHGNEEYKFRLSTGEHALSSGTVAVTGLSKIMAGMKWKVRQMLEYPALQTPARFLRSGINRARRIMGAE
jgi:CelD/BcsL family acetyltransferase involved in cellulose biosynthesis